MGAALIQTDRATRTVHGRRPSGARLRSGRASRPIRRFRSPRRAVFRRSSNRNDGRRGGPHLRHLLLGSTSHAHIHAVDELSHDRVALHGRPGRRQHGVDHRSSLGSRSVGLGAAAGRSDHDLRGSPLVAPRVAPTFEFSGETFRQLSGFAVQIAGGRWARLIELLVMSLLIGKLVAWRPSEHGPSR